MTKALIRFSVEHPHIVIAFYLGVFLLFIAALPFLPLRMMPYVQSPMIAVITRYPGMTPREVETYLSKPIEEKMTDIQGVRYIRSTSMDGISIVSLEFPYGWDMKKAYNDVLVETQRAMGDLPYDPANLKPPWVLPIDPLNLPVITLALTAPGWDPVKLRQFADNTVVEQFKTIPGVESVYAFGGLIREAQVIVDRNKLASDGLSILDVKKSLDAYNLDLSGGTLTYGPSEISIRYTGRLRKGSHLDNIAVGHARDGSVVYLKDVGKEIDTFAEQRSLYRYNGHDAVAVNVIQLPWASEPQTIAGVMKKAKTLEENYPGIHFANAFNRAHFVEIIRHNTDEELILSIVLTAVALFFFLGEWRGTLIALITIPTSLGIALLLFFPLGFSMNSSTLIGLLLAIGRLVDDSIIDLHNIHRHLKMGKPPKQAVIEGCGEVRGAIVAVTFMLVLALIPLIFAGGIVSQMFAGINIPFILALLASLLVSMTLTPLLSAYLFPPYKEGYSDGSTRITQPFITFLNRLDKKYCTWVYWSLQNKGLIMAVVLAFFVIPFMLYPHIGEEMMPLADVGQGYLQMEAWPGTSLQKTSEMAKKLDAILLSHPEIKKVSEQIGNEMGGTYFTGYSMGDVNTVMDMITLSDKSERKKSIWQIIHEVRSEALRTIPGIRTLTFKEMGSDVMASSRAPIEVVIYGPNLKKLYDLAQATVNLVKSDPNLHQISTSWSYTKPEYDLEIDPSAAETLGLTPKEIAMQVYYATQGGLTQEYFNPPNVRHDFLLIRYPLDERRNLHDLLNVQITAGNGESVPLKSIAHIVKTVGPSLIEHDQLRRSISVLVYYRKGGPGSMALTEEIMMKALLNLPFPPGYGIEMRGDMTQMMDAFKRMDRGMVLALIFIFLSLVAMFRSFAQAITMMAAIPLSFFGAFMALILAHQTFSTVSILGFVFLNGISLTASILVVEFIMILRETGVPREEAIVESAVIRLRPILMTVFISLIVLFPVAFFPKTGMDAYSPLATVMIGGLFSATILSLLAVPVIYSLMDDMARWMREFPVKWLHQIFSGKSEVQS
jgi:HAE1 family hydrophobic/amphiphilic exporter-1